MLHHPPCADVFDAGYHLREEDKANLLTKPWEDAIQIHSPSLHGIGRGESSLPVKLRIFVYLSHTLSSWGDRMWSFGVGLFMVIISPDSLRVTAFYGLANNIAVLLFGAIVGDWVDKTPRLKAARTTLIFQNTSVAVCGVFLFFVMKYKDELQSRDGALALCYVAIIAIAIISNLASMGTSLAIQRDWVVEICRRDKDTLASMTAVMRRIDLTTKLAAPIATGQIMYFASPGIGALFIAGWNIVSVFIEYVLLWKVYIQVPELRSKKKGYKKEPEPSLIQEETPLQPEDPVNEIEMEDYGSKPETVDTKHKAADTPVEDQNETDQLNTIPSEESEPAQEIAIDTVESGAVETNDKHTQCCCPCCKLMLSGPLTLWRGWRTFMKYDVAFAGLGLACLYMTVLGFDNITVGYAYSQGVNESIMGILMAAGAITGILGTFFYPVAQKRMGLERTGLFGFFFEICFLCLCVASVWAPGSPFDPLFTGKNELQLIKCDGKAAGNDLALTGLLTTTPVVVLNGSDLGAVYNVSFVNQSTADTSFGLTTSTEGLWNSTTPGLCDKPQPWQTYISVTLLMTGIIGARFGLWIADLTITQLFLENVKETERGIVSGTQTSLNKLMDMLKFVMVVAAPEPQVFGVLVLISFIFILLGWVSYCKYSYKTRGHLLPCHLSGRYNNSNA